MKVVSACSALLSDFEVLSVLRDLQNQQVRSFRSVQKASEAGPDAMVMAEANANADARAADVPDETTVPLSSEEEEAYLRYLPENLKDVQLEAVESFVQEMVTAGFSGPYGPRGRPQGILSKVEQLQILNHAPSKMVELYTIVDELETRLESEDVDALLSIVQRTLPPPTPFAEMAVDEPGAEAQAGTMEDDLMEEDGAGAEAEDEDAAMDDQANDFVQEERVAAEDMVGDEAADDD